ncbi:Cu-Zn family superoxide dismutase [Sphingomonas sp. BE123]|uniref:superoxide dismutase family protein n=1 Tax=Sphingomonas sp. BE123 TaxID=2817842 RepID=UPI002859835E|nr:superoxide dismutase family protein [Sphingomonas sp. BE123]MDR6852824.1 Cu-Zn family superoxide dismutase [Sphingomonas sp. BE123]
MIRTGCAIAALALTAACSGGATSSDPARATAQLKRADGSAAGSAVATVTNGGLSVNVSVTGISPGPHGVHVHMTGKCDAPGFTTAGGHWNPGATQHGLENPQGAHAGDMPNLIVQPDGTGTLTYKLGSGTMDGLLDADGAAFVVHAGPDDQKTDPSGNSGDRIACGVFAAG